MQLLMLVHSQFVAIVKNYKGKKKDYNFVSNTLKVTWAEFKEEGKSHASPLDSKLYCTWVSFLFVLRLAVLDGSLTVDGSYVCELENWSIICFFFYLLLNLNFYYYRLLVVTFRDSKYKFRFIDPFIVLFTVSWKDPDSRNPDHSHAKHNRVPLELELNQYDTCNEQSRREGDLLDKKRAFLIKGSFVNCKSQNYHGLFGFGVTGFSEWTFQYNTYSCVMINHSILIDKLENKHRSIKIV